MGFEGRGGSKDFFQEEGNRQEKQQDPFFVRNYSDELLRA